MGCRSRSLMWFPVPVPARCREGGNPELEPCHRQRANQQAIEYPAADLRIQPSARSVERQRSSVALRIPQAERSSVSEIGALAVASAVWIFSPADTGD